MDNSHRDGHLVFVDLIGLRGCLRLNLRGLFLRNYFFGSFGSLRSSFRLWPEKSQLVEDDNVSSPHDS